MGFNMKKKGKETNYMEVIKQELLKRKFILLSEAKKEIGKHLNGDFREGADKSGDNGLGSVRDASEDVSLELLGSKTKIVQSINTALKKIENNTYGICEECEDNINEKRLKVNPYASLCIACQEEKEKEERFYN
jgi:DnaK suppressor protein